jgi:hypothetical protein
MLRISSLRMCATALGPISLSVYLLTEQKWDEARIGIVMSVATIAGSVACRRGIRPTNLHNSAGTDHLAGARAARTDATFGRIRHEAVIDP